MRRLSLAFVAIVTCGLTFAPVQADHFPSSSDFSILGTKWEPGGDAAFIGWDPGEFPSPGSAYFSIMGAGKVDVSGFPDGDHVGATKDITALGVAGWAAADYAAMIDWALDQWAAVSGFVNSGGVPDGGGDAGATGAAGAMGSIRVAAWEISTAGVLAHAYAPGTEADFGAGWNIGGDVHFDTGWSWVDDDSLDGSEVEVDIYTVALHEIGHALGVGHSGVVGSVMEPIYAGSRRTLSADDIAAIQAIYGPNQVVPEPGTIVGMFSLAGFGFSVFVARRRRAKNLAA